jgi:hypothetical protein
MTAPGSPANKPLSTVLIRTAQRWHEQRGLSSNARQIRPTVDFDRPLRSAIEARVQCVAVSGVDSNVATKTSSTCSAVIVAGRPGRGASNSPSNRNSQNRERHIPTVGVDTATSSSGAARRASSGSPDQRRPRAGAASEDQHERWLAFRVLPSTARTQLQWAVMSATSAHCMVRGRAGWQEPRGAASRHGGPTRS